MKHSGAKSRFKATAQGFVPASLNRFKYRRGAPAAAATTRPWCSFVYLSEMPLSLLYPGHVQYSIVYYNVKHRNGTGNVCTRKYGWLLPKAACLGLANLALLSFFSLTDRKA